MLINDYKSKICTPFEMVEILNKILLTEQEFDRDKEHFYAIGLDSGNRIVYIDIVTVGTLNASLIHPRETFRVAILKAVAGIIIAHNHPSGDPIPSEHDKTITKQLIESGKILGIPVLDHIIFCKTDNYFSFANHGII
jgi:DNA repair protein RadC